MSEAPRRLPPLDLIKGFEAAARLSNVTLAADELALTQSAVSRQVKALEEHLGATLFVRRPRGLELTAPGRRYYDAAARALKLLREAGEELRGAPRTLTVTTTPGFASLWLIPRLAAFTRTHRDIDVRISATYDTLDLERKAVDFAIRYGAAKPAGAVWLFGERLMPVASPALLADPRRPLQAPADLRHHVLLQIENDRTSVPWMDWATWFRAMGIEEVKPAGVLRFERYDEVISAALAGQGVAPGGVPLLRQHLRDGRLVAPFARSIATPRGYYLVEAASAARGGAAADFARWIKAEAARAKVAAG
ncbi:MAG: LysR family transcriptional regulator [Burkholderiales bacterium]|nr:LysR family transcriptional regulator [Burkholderiales bacterium]